jgi:hypothetical protein
MASAKKAAAGSRSAAAIEIPVNDGGHFTMECPTDRFLSRLNGVRQVGLSRWVALCPSHDDRHPSLAIRETDDGTLLLKCFGGCGAHEIVSAVGMELHDLFPQRSPGDHVRSPERRPWPASDVLRCIKNESMILASLGISMLNGQFTEADRERLIEAAGRTQAATTMGGC